MRVRRRTSRLVSGAVLVTGAIALAAAPVGAGTVGTLNVEARNFAFTLSDSTLEPGKYQLSFTNVGTAPHEFVAFKLAEGYENLTIEQLQAAADQHDDSVIDRFAGAAFAPPGGSDTGKLKLKEEGVYAYFCFIGSPEDPHYRRGMVGTLTVQ